MKTTLPLTKIKDFLKLGNYINTEKISQTVPVTRYIKFEICFGLCIITKTNMQSFVQYSFDVSDNEECMFLMDEKKLKVIADNSKSDYIEFTLKSDRVDLTDGYYKSSFKWGIDTPEIFPATPEIGNSYITIASDVLLSIGIASKYCGKDELRPNFMFTYLKNGIVYASDFFKCYARITTTTIPDISMSVNECSLISTFPFIMWSVAGNYNIYKHGNIIYGFIKSNDAVGFDPNFFIGQISNEDFVTIDVEDLSNFCTTTLALDSSAQAKFTVQENMVTMSFFNDENGDSNILEVSGVLKGESFEFIFNPFTWVSLIKSYPYKEMSISLDKSFIHIFNEDDTSLHSFVGRVVDSIKI